MCSMSHKLKKYRTPAHRSVPLVRSSPCVIAPSRSPYFGHFAKALQNVSKVRCSLVWAIMDSSVETLAALTVRRRFLQVCGESAVRRRFRVFAARAQRAVVFACLRRECSAQALSRVCGESAARSRFRVFAARAQCAGVFACLRRERSAQSFSRVCGGSAVRRRFRVFAARAQRAVVFVCLRRECGAQALFASLRRERSAQVFSHLRAYLPPFVNGVPGNTGSLK